MSKLLSILFVLIGFSSVSQIRQIKMSVYFDTDKYNLRKDAKITLDQLADSIKGLDITKIVARGNTDNRADSLYNVTLSQNRTSTVSKYLIAKGQPEKLFTQEHFGEDKPIAANADEKGMQNNRRVDVIVYYRVKKAPEPPKEVAKTPVPTVAPPKTVTEKEVNPCAEDTTILLSNGTQVVMTKCEFRKRGNCLDIQAALSPDEAAKMNLTTRTDDGAPLASAGMISIMPKAGCDGSCFDPPLKVRFPIKTDCPLQGPSMFNMDASGAWVANREKLNVVTINGVSYYEFEVRCPGRKNVDKKVKYGKTKVKAPRGYHMLEATFTKGCPLERYVYHGTLNKNNRYKRKLVAKNIPCDIASGDIRSLVIDKKTGDTLEIAIKPVANLRKRPVSACKECNQRRFLWIFKARRHIRPMLHRKYVYKRRRDKPQIIVPQPVVSTENK